MFSQSGSTVTTSLHSSRYLDNPATTRRIQLRFVHQIFAPEVTGKQSSMDSPNKKPTSAAELPPVISFRTQADRTSILVTGRLGNFFRRLVVFLATSIYRYFSSKNVLYREMPLSPESAARLAAVGRKTLVLDLDETLIHSCFAELSPEKTGCPCMVPPHVPPDFVINVVCNKTTVIPVRAFKRPHIDLFLGLVSKWYDLVIFTASTEAYADQVLDYLDGGRGVLNRRFYRQHCRADKLMAKDLDRIGTSMRDTFIIDNLPKSYAEFPDNALPIKSFFYDIKDTELLTLLPFLDALRFAHDVRSVLGRRAYKINT